MGSSGTLTASYDLRALGWLWLRHGLVEPELVAVGILDRERAVSPPLGREGTRDPDPTPLELVVVALHVLDLDVDVDRSLAGRPFRPGDLLLGPREHDADAGPDHGDEVEPAVLADDTHQVLEPELLGVEAVDLVDRVHGDDRHDPEPRFLAHPNLHPPMTGR